MKRCSLIAGIVLAVLSSVGCGVDRGREAPPAAKEIETISQGIWTACGIKIKQCLCTSNPGGEGDWQSKCLKDLDAKCPPGSAPGCAAENCTCTRGLVSFPITCEGACGVYDENRVCQCDEACALYGDCCPDHKTLCSLSCSGRCGSYDSRSLCQCDNACGGYGDCCLDYANACTKGCSCDSQCHLLNNCCTFCL